MFSIRMILHKYYVRVYYATIYYFFHLLYREIITTINRFNREPGKLPLDVDQSHYLLKIF